MNFEPKHKNGDRKTVKLIQIHSPMIQFLDEKGQILLDNLSLTKLLSNN